MSARPASLVLVVGTATEIGKTWVTCRLAEHLRGTGVAVAARKPAQSFAPGDEVAGVTDAQLLAAATGAAPEEVTPRHRWYAVPMAPPMATEVLGHPPLHLRTLIDELKWPPDVGVGLLETAGAVRSPLAVDGDAVVLAARTRPDLVLVVADAGLGTIGSVRSAADALAGHPLVVFLNRHDEGDDLHRRNSAWLRARDRFEVCTTVETLADRVRG